MGAGSTRWARSWEIVTERKPRNDRKGLQVKIVARWENVVRSLQGKANAEAVHEKPRQVEFAFASKREV